MRLPSLRTLPAVVVVAASIVWAAGGPSPARAQETPVPGGTATALPAASPMLTPLPAATEGPLAAGGGLSAEDKQRALGIVLADERIRSVLRERKYVVEGVHFAKRDEGLSAGLIVYLRLNKPVTLNVVWPTVNHDRYVGPQWEGDAVTQRLRAEDVRGLAAHVDLGANVVDGVWLTDQYRTLEETSAPFRWAPWLTRRVWLIPVLAIAAAAGLIIARRRVPPPWSVTVLIVLGAWLTFALVMWALGEPGDTPFPFNLLLVGPFTGWPLALIAGALVLLRAPPPRRGSWAIMLGFASVGLVGVAVGMSDLVDDHSLVSALALVALVVISAGEAAVPGPSRRGDRSRREAADADRTMVA